MTDRVTELLQEMIPPPAPGSFDTGAVPLTRGVLETARELRVPLPETIAVHPHWFEEPVRCSNAAEYQLITREGATEVCGECLPVAIVLGNGGVIVRPLTASTDVEVNS